MGGNILKKARKFLSINKSIS